jgi:G-protein alpha subunit
VAGTQEGVRQTEPSPSGVPPRCDDSAIVSHVPFPNAQSDELKEFLSERPWLLHDSLLFHLSIMEDLARIAAPDYSVTEEDILDVSNGDACTCERCPVHFENVVFNVTCVSLTHLDLHGLQGLDEPHIVAFVASLTGFDQTHGEEGVNKMMRSMGSLRTLCGMEALQQECVTCVVLTKQDLFAEKMRYSDVAAIADFDDFEGESEDTDGAFDYFIDKFQSCLPSRSDNLVIPFDAETNDVATILLGRAKMLLGPVQNSDATATTAQPTHKAASMVVEQTTPSAAIEVTRGDDDEFYTETIEV